MKKQKLQSKGSPRSHDRVVFSEKFSTPNFQITFASGKDTITRTYAGDIAEAHKLVEREAKSNLQLWYAVISEVKEVCGFFDSQGNMVTSHDFEKEAEK